MKKQIISIFAMTSMLCMPVLKAIEPNSVAPIDKPELNTQPPAEQNSPGLQQEAPIPTPDNTTPSSPQEIHPSTPIDPTEATTTTLTPTETPDAIEDGTSVSHASNKGIKTARNKAWKNIGLAVGAVIAAIVALVLVSKNSGHSK